MKKYQGDISITDKFFVKKINKTCATENIFDRTPEQGAIDRKRCILSKINFKYDKLVNIGGFYPESGLEHNKKINLIKNDHLSIYIQR